MYLIKAKVFDVQWKKAITMLSLYHKTRFNDYQYIKHLPLNEEMKQIVWDVDDGDIVDLTDEQVEIVKTFI